MNNIIGSVFGAIIIAGSILYIQRNCHFNINSDKKTQLSSDLKNMQQSQEKFQQEIRKKLDSIENAIFLLKT